MTSCLGTHVCTCVVGLRDAQAGKNKTVGQFRVAGKAWDLGLGGSHFDSVLIEKLADAFNALGHLGKGGDVRTLPKAMTKLKKNAQKVRLYPSLIHLLSLLMYLLSSAS